MKTKNPAYAESFKGLGRLRLPTASQVPALMYSIATRLVNQTVGSV